MNRIMLLANVNVDKMRLHRESWMEQIRDALTVNGGDIENATNMDYLMHVLTFFWKVLFSLVPPPAFAGGWLTFIISLIVIGGLTAIVGQYSFHFQNYIPSHNPR